MQKKGILLTLIGFIFLSLCPSSANAQKAKAIRNAVTSLRRPIVPKLKPSGRPSPNPRPPIGPVIIGEKAARADQKSPANINNNPLLRTISRGEQFEPSSKEIFESASKDLKRAFHKNNAEDIQQQYQPIATDFIPSQSLEVDIYNSFPLRHIEESPKRDDSVSIPVKVDNKWWIEYIRGIIEEQMIQLRMDKMEKQLFKNGMQIDVEIEEDGEIVGYIIYNYEYRIDAA